MCPEVRESGVTVDEEEEEEGREAVAEAEEDAGGGACPDWAANAKAARSWIVDGAFVEGAVRAGGV